MKKRPLSVTLISCLFLVAGVVGIAYHSSELKELGAAPDSIWVLAVRLLAIIGGVFALRGENWARWLLLAWISYHVFLSMYHPVSELVMHVVLLIVVIYILFLSKASTYFRKQG